MANVPATALSRYDNNDPISALVIGSNSVFPSPNPSSAFNWFVVVDLTTLKFVQTVTTTDNVTVPPEVLQYQGNSQYFLYFITNVQPSYNLPQGALATFLTAVGSGPQLAQLEQIVEQLSTGAIVGFSYVLAATMTENDTPGYESSSIYDYSVLAMAFMPIVIDGQTIYAPVQPFGAVPPA